MIECAWPYLLVLLPLPWLVYRFFPASKSSQEPALQVPLLAEWDTCGSSSTSFPKKKFLFAFLIWAALVVAASRPQWVGEAIEISQSGRDLMLAVDLSGSMQTRDFEIKGCQTDRLTATKYIASDFINQRKGDRIGLILFGSQAYLQAPLTFDLATVKQLLVESAVGLAGMDTSIGDAIGLAVKYTRESPNASRVLVLLTDGNNNCGKLTLEKAAELAQHAGLKVHTVAIGANEMMVASLFGMNKVNPSANIDEKALQMVADTTGGKYFRAYNTQELSEIYKEIDRLEPIERDRQIFRPKEELYRYPLMLALAGIGLFMLRRRLW
jgi:Ca-activated chloride channel family protein